MSRHCKGNRFSDFFAPNLSREVVFFNVRSLCKGTCIYLLTNFSAKIYQGASGSRVVSANFEFRQKVFVSTKVGVTTFAPGGKISEMTSQIMFGYVLTRVLLCKCVENMV